MEKDELEKENKRLHDEIFIQEQNKTHSINKGILWFVVVIFILFITGTLM